MNESDLINRTLDALDRLMKMFAFERILYLICAIVSFGLLITCLVLMYNSGAASVPQLALAFGSSGLIAASAARVSFFLNKAFDLISVIVQKIAHQENNP
jgi:hypothetical protein